MHIGTDDADDDDWRRIAIFPVDDDDGRCCCPCGQWSNDNMITIIGIIVIDSLVYKLASTDGAAIIHVKATPMESFLE